MILFINVSKLITLSPIKSSPIGGEKISWNSFPPYSSLIAYLAKPYRVNAGMGWLTLVEESLHF